jgi:hypothetical protein
VKNGHGKYHNYCPHNFIILDSFFLEKMSIEQKLAIFAIELAIIMAAGTAIGMIGNNHLAFARATGGNGGNGGNGGAGGAAN